MKILAIETSCDDTGVAIIEATGGLKKPVFKVLANITSSQVALHAKYGGVFPMMAKREHAKNLAPILKQVLKKSKLLKTNPKPVSYELKAKSLETTLSREPELLVDLLKLLPKIKRPDIDAIAVTYGPGLEPTLWVGINFAKALSLAWNIPVVPINHMEGHVFAGLLQKRAGQKSKIENRKLGNSLQPTHYNLQPVYFPALALLISGGHTELVLMKDWFKYKIVGETLDDAVGEAFDKVARMFGLPYPGGPEISRLAKLGRENPLYKLPRPMLHSKDLNFSFSGLKTAVLYTLKKVPKLNDKIKADIACEFEDASAEVLVAKTMTALKKYKAKTLILGGGVSANQKIRQDMTLAINEKFPDCPIYLPEASMTGDNALMIAVAGYFRVLKLKSGGPRAQKTFSAKGNLRL